MLDSDEKDFIQEICCGIVQYQELINSCCNLIYARNVQLRPSTRPLYWILFYYIIFLLPVNSFKSLKQIMATQYATITLPFLRLVW